MKRLHTLLIALCLPLSLSANNRTKDNHPSLHDFERTYGLDQASRNFRASIAVYGIMIGIFTMPASCIAGLASGVATAYNPTSVGKYFAVGLGGGAMGSLFTIRTLLSDDQSLDGVSAALGAVWATASFVIGLLGGLALKTAYNKTITS